MDPVESNDPRFDDNDRLDWDLADTGADDEAEGCPLVLSLSLRDRWLQYQMKTWINATIKVVLGLVLNPRSDKKDLCLYRTHTRGHTPEEISFSIFQFLLA